MAGGQCTGVHKCHIHWAGTACKLTIIMITTMYSGRSIANLVCHLNLVLVKEKPFVNFTVLCISVNVFSTDTKR